MYAHVLYVDTVDEHLALLHVVIARDKVHQRGLSSSALPYKCNGLTFLHSKVDVAEYPFLRIAEGHVAEFYLAVEACGCGRYGRLLDVVLRHEDFVHALHGRQSLGYVVASL